MQEERVVERAEDALEAPVVIVRAGAIDRFAALRAAFAPDGVDVIWDRRVAERRRAPVGASPPDERRRQDRRGTIPESWRLLDFLVVPGRPAVS
jgi:hypothetical protein